MWRNFILVLTIALFYRATTAQAEDSSKCGKLNLTQTFNGQILAELDEFPWTGAVIMKNDNGKRYTKCSAALISDRYLLTNSYCFATTSDPKEIRIVLGFWKLLNLDDGIKENCDNNKRCGPLPRLYHIDEIVRHPDFNGGANDDIALIRLKESVEFTDYIQPLCLPTEENLSEDYVKEILVYMGWPEFESKSTALLTKSKLFAYGLDLKTCDEKFSADINSNKFVCAYCSRKEKFSIGGALLGMTVKNTLPDHHFLLGLVSLRRGFCEFGSPDVFVRVDYYLDWIKSNMH